MNIYRIYLKQSSKGYWFILSIQDRPETKTIEKRMGLFKEPFIRSDVVEVVKDSVATDQCSSYENAI